jgi:uncharacterized protein (TIGR03086 family)
MAPSDTAGPVEPATAGAGPAQHHRQVAGHFGDLTRGTLDWDAPAPVDGWTARDVVRHLVEWLSGFLASGAGVELPAGPSVDDDPAATWQVHADAVQALLDDPATADRLLTNPHIGQLPLPGAIDTFYTSDVFLHTWDLARATGQDDRLDPAVCAAMLAGMQPMEGMLRSSGQYGPAVPVPADADPQSRLIGFIGRDPAWTPSH